MEGWPGPPAGVASAGSIQALLKQETTATLRENQHLVFIEYQLWGLGYVVTVEFLGF